MCARKVLREHARSQPERRAVGQRDSLLLGIEGYQGHDGAKKLNPERLDVVVFAFHERGGHEIARARQGRATKADFRTLCRRFDQCFNDPGDLGIGAERPPYGCLRP